MSQIDADCPSKFQEMMAKCVLRLGMSDLLQGEVKEEYAMVRCCAHRHQSDEIVFVGLIENILPQIEALPGIGVTPKTGERDLGCTCWIPTRDNDLLISDRIPKEEGAPVQIINPRRTVLPRDFNRRKCSET
jgi:hypothetical protein